MSGSSSTAHSTVYINLTASTEKLDSYSTARHPGTCSQPRQPRQLLDRSSTGSTGKASTAPRQSTRQRLDGASTARQLDSQGSTFVHSQRPALSRTDNYGIGGVFYTRKGNFLYKISLYIIIYLDYIIVYHVYHDHVSHISCVDRLYHLFSLRHVFDDTWT